MPTVSLVLLLEDHSGVDDLQALALLVDEDRVGVGLSDFVAELADELRDSGDGLGEDLLVADLLATSAVEHREALDLLHHLVGGVLVERGDTESDVLEDFDEDAALTEKRREQRMSLHHQNKQKSSHIQQHKSKQCMKSMFVGIIEYSIMHE